MHWQIITVGPKLDVFKARNKALPSNLGDIVGKRTIGTPLFLTRPEVDRYYNGGYLNHTFWNFEIQELDEKGQVVNRSKSDSSSSAIGPAVNDHVCPECGNNRCSKVEKTCWRCGASLHGAQ